MFQTSLASWSYSTNSNSTIPTRFASAPMRYKPDPVKLSGDAVAPPVVAVHD